MLSRASDGGIALLQVEDAYYWSLQAVWRIRCPFQEQFEGQKGYFQAILLVIGAFWPNLRPILLRSSIQASLVRPDMLVVALLAMLPTYLPFLLDLIGAHTTQELTVEGIGYIHTSNRC